MGSGTTKSPRGMEHIEIRDPAWPAGPSSARPPQPPLDAQVKGAGLTVEGETLVKPTSNAIGRDCWLPHADAIRRLGSENECPPAGCRPSWTRANVRWRGANWT